jgi:hypothetical protein
MSKSDMTNGQNVNHLREVVHLAGGEITGFSDVAENHVIYISNWLKSGRSRAHKIHRGELHHHLSKCRGIKIIIICIQETLS